LPCVEGRKQEQNSCRGVKNVLVDPKIFGLVERNTRRYVECLAWWGNMKFKKEDVRNFIDSLSNDFYIEDWDYEKEEALLDEKTLSGEGTIDIKRSEIWICYQGEETTWDDPEPKEFTYALKKWLNDRK
jgi:hypothetical protein